MRSCVVFAALGSLLGGCGLTLEVDPSPDVGGIGIDSGLDMWDSAMSDGRPADVPVVDASSDVIIDFDGGVTDAVIPDASTNGTCRAPWDLAAVASRSGEEQIRSGTENRG